MLGGEGLPYGGGLSTIIPVFYVNHHPGPDSYDPATNTVKDARSLYVIYIPFATTQTTGISSKPTPGEPWLMFPGTPKAHIMFVPTM